MRLSESSWVDFRLRCLRSLPREGSSLPETTYSERWQTHRNRRRRLASFTGREEGDLQSAPFYIKIRIPSIVSGISDGPSARAWRKDTPFGVNRFRANDLCHSRVRAGVNSPPLAIGHAKAGIISADGWVAILRDSGPAIRRSTDPKVTQSLAVTSCLPSGR